MLTGWHTIENVGDIDSPALLFYPDRIAENIRRALAISGGPARLRPHIKTHKCSEVLRMQLDVGITRFKCATIAEAHMAAEAGAHDVLLAYQPGGPRGRRFSNLIDEYGHVMTFSCIVDNAATIEEFASIGNKQQLRVLLDIDCGQGRTGVPPGPRAVELYKLISNDARLKAGGLHAYDGHIHDVDFAARKIHCDESFAPVAALRRELLDGGMDVPAIVAGGTPTFPIHAKRDPALNVECSPGTHILWDAGYSQLCPDLDFQIAALVLTRVASKPAANRLCLDLGHKAIASERPHPRVLFPELTNCRYVMHSEEHLVVEADNAHAFNVSDALYGIPWHICPTVALYQEAQVIQDHRAEQTWKIEARDRRIAY